MKASFSEIIRSETPVLVDFYADWCGPCKMLSPILKEVKDALGDRLKVIKIDVDQHQALAGRYQVRGVPTMVLFKKGKVLWRQSGVLPRDALLKAIKPLL
ncbi:thioredoxin [Robiginitalea sp. SC105]|uniref:thioredoxin n=1 Tax=Robiginitalea sp. SC105 TaxID=2762332 RepID=UPI001C8D16CB|nr:thioredoxin [Robiginitalea sp. SC105]